MAELPKLEASTGLGSRFSQRLVFYAIPLLLYYLLWWIAFFPAVVTYDFVDLWAFGSLHSIPDWHPFVYTSLILALRQIADSPAIVSLFQVLCTVLIVSYGFSTLERIGIERKICKRCYALFFLTPAIAIYNVSPLKDVPFSQGIVLLGLLFVAQVFPVQKNVRGVLRFLAVGSFIVLVASLRHNGTICLAFPLLYFTLPLKSKRQVYFLQFFVVSVFLAVQVGLAGYLGINREDSQLNRSTILLQMFGNAIQSKWTPSVEEAATLQRILPLGDLEERYHCCDWSFLQLQNPDFHSEVFREREFMEKFLTMSARLFIHHPGYLLGDRLCMAINILGLGSPRWSYLYDTRVVRNPYGFTQQGWKALREFLEYLLDATATFPVRFLFWTHLLFIVASVVILLRACEAKDWLLAGFMLTLLIHVPVLLLIAPSNHYRYLLMLEFGLPFALAMHFGRKARGQIQVRRT